MADIKVKPTRKKASMVKRVPRVQKLKESNKPSAAEYEFEDEENDIYQDETQCLLRSALNMKKSCYEQENDEQDNNIIDKFQPIDKLISSEVHNKISDYEQSLSIAEEDNQDYLMVGCRFPNGIVISLGKSKQLLRGINDMPDQEKLCDYKDVGFTKIARTIWKTFLKTHQNWPPLLNGSVFVMNNTML